MIRESTQQHTKRPAIDALLALALLASMSVSAFAQSGTWTSTGSMKDAREDQTATLLQTSHLLVAGGFDGSNQLATAELYDPTTGKWSVTGSMNTARDGQTATLLQDGQVLVAGDSTHRPTAVSIICPAQSCTTPPRARGRLPAA